MCVQIVVKQTVKQLNVVIRLKNFNKRKLHCLINKKGNVRLLLTLRRLRVSTLAEKQ